MVWYFHLFKNFPQFVAIHTVKGFGVVNKAEVAWKIPWMEEPGRLQSMWSLRVGHDLNDFTFTFHFHALEKEMAAHSSVLAWRIPGTGKPGGFRLWGRTELDMTEAT